jgi:hypothetical protein
MRVKAILALAAALAAVSASLSISQAPAKETRPNAQCSLASTGLVPMTDMGNRRYRGYRGGLYPGGLNKPSAKYLKKGMIASKQVRPINGKIVLLSIGMSNASAEFSAFKRSSDNDALVNPKLVVVDGAQDGFDATNIIARPAYWDNVDTRLSAAGVTASQVQVVWLKEAIAGEHRRFPKDAKALQTSLRKIINTMRLRFPKLRLVYLSSRTYGGYAITGWNPEPAAYDGGFAVRAVIQDRINGKLKGPWVGWGPYLWTDGLADRSDGLQWTCDDVEADGTHPSKSGVQKVVTLLTTFFKTDPTAKRWYVSKARP